VQPASAPSSQTTFDARRTAGRVDEARDHASRPPLAGLTVSIKDLFDVTGGVTAAGSTVLAGNRPAEADCPQR
jgi:Asp-tRNA(Asn)/Glu-tRNA(Gln) amidotransferase A subunit family amidase